MRIVVAGAGIAGLTSALTLAATGHDVTVLERRTGFGEAGAGIQLSPNASRILIGLGLGPALARVACEPERIAARTFAGRPVGAVRLGPFMRERFGAPFLAVLRADLHTLLLDAVRGRPGIRLRVGRGVAGVADGPDGLVVSTEGSGGSQDALGGDLLVAADGLWSRVRSEVGLARRPAPSGFAAYRALVPTGRVSPEIEAGDTGLWLGPGRHVVHYPVAAGNATNVVVVAPRPAPVEGWSAETEAGLVREAVAGASPLLRGLVAAAESWSAWSLVERPLDRMGRGRVAFVGDAAHPVLPYLAQGGSLAIEDAAVLAACLAARPGTVPDAVRLYERQRSKRVRRVQSEARRNGRRFHAGPLVGAARNLVMGRLGPERLAERYGWLYGWQPPELPPPPA